MRKMVSTKMQNRKTIIPQRKAKLKLGGEKVALDIYKAS